MNKRFSFFKYQIFKQAAFSVFSFLIFFLNSCIYAGVEKQHIDSFKGQQIIFDYKGHNNEREIAFKYFSATLPSFHGDKGIDTDNVENHNIGIAKYDIDDDGQEEILAYLNDSGYCGSAGCVFQIIKTSNNNYRKFISSNISVQEKIKILDDIYMNHHDILLYNRFGNPTSIWRWNGNKYDILKSFTIEH